uniref:Aldehyde dehydrogenase domain-containing protein n=1 Tax=Dunaliella tertiolecta TaxID=3047 RepID=A0A7S3VMI7_DUNTE
MACESAKRAALYIDGKLCVPALGADSEVINPSTEEVIGHIALGSEEDADLAFEAAAGALKGWKCMPGIERGRYLRSLGGKVQEKKAELSRLEAQDCGKVLDEAEQDMDDAVTCLLFYADLAEQLDKQQNEAVDVESTDFRVEVRKEPFGVVALLTPWNYPLLIALWKIAPALAAGNTIVHKPSENASLTCMVFAAMCIEVGLPPGVLNIITGKGNLGAAISKNPGYAKISFTGSTTVGRSIAMAAAANLIPCTLELGGKGAIIVFDDADINQAVEWVMYGAFWVNGQCCSATSRLLVHSTIAPAFLEKLVQRTKAIKVDDALAPAARLGPQVTSGQMEKVRAYIQSGIDEGAKILTGGSSRPAHLGRGYFVQPTVFVDVKAHHRIWREEIFGPVLSVMQFTNEQEAITLANDSEYGLAGAVISKDSERCRHVVENLDCGITWCVSPLSVLT